MSVVLANKKADSVNSAKHLSGIGATMFTYQLLFVTLELNPELIQHLRGKTLWLANNNLMLESQFFPRSGFRPDVSGYYVYDSRTGDLHIGTGSIEHRVIAISGKGPLMLDILDEKTEQKNLARFILKPQNPKKLARLTFGFKGRDEIAVRIVDPTTVERLKVRIDETERFLTENAKTNTSELTLLSELVTATRAALRDIGDDTRRKFS